VPSCLSFIPKRAILAPRGDCRFHCRFPIWPLPYRIQALPRFDGHYHGHYIFRPLSNPCKGGIGHMHGFAPLPTRGLPRGVPMWHSLCNSWAKLGQAPTRQVMSGKRLSPAPSIGHNARMDGQL